MSKVAIIGGGPSGMLAAATAAYAGHSVVLFEKNEKLGKKLYLTGKGRCNITNNCDISDFFEHIPRNPKFLYSALYSFGNQDIVSILNANGVPTKVERGERVFPVSDHSSDVIRALGAYLKKSGATVLLGAGVETIVRRGEGFTVRAAAGQYDFDAVVLCTGGMSYPSTGSTGDGYRFAQILGHSLVAPSPSLIPLETVEAWPKSLMGLSLKNVTLTAYRNGKRVFEELGEMLFTHFGVSGPLVLSASGRLADSFENAVLQIDLKPALDMETLDKRIVRDFEKYQNKRLCNALLDLLPSKLVPVIIELSGIPPEIPVNQVTKDMRGRLASLLKALSLHVKRPLPLEEAIITRGGIPVKEIDASTMESKLVKNLFFAGEVVDVDAYTGGFNLQIAYSTGVLAGRSIK